jgi:hypothetical protein
LFIMSTRFVLQSLRVRRTVPSFRAYSYTPRAYVKPQDSKPVAAKPTPVNVDDALEAVSPSIPSAPPVDQNGGSPFSEGGGDGAPRDWSRSYHGLSTEAFSKEVAEVLLAPVDPLDIEMKPGTR